MRIGNSLCVLATLGLSALMAHDVAVYGPVLPLEKVQDSAGAQAMVNTGKHLYTASNGRLQVFSLKDPLHPKLAGELKGFRGGRQMAWNGNYLYITARNFGLWIVDISNREQPKLAGRFDSTELATGVAVSGNLCFVAHRVYGTQVLDITDPVHPRHLSTIRTQEAQTVTFRGKLLFIGDWAAGEVTIADVSDPRVPKILSKTKLDGFGDGLDAIGPLCIASTGHHSFKLGGAKSEKGFGMGHGIELLDISDPSKPKHLSTLKFPKFYQLGNDFWTVRICGNMAYAVDTHNGFFMVDITDRKNPRCLGHAVLPEAPHYNPATGNKNEMGNDCATSIALGDGCVYITGDRTGLYVLPVPGKSSWSAPESSHITIGPEKPLPVPKGLVRYDIAGGEQVRRVALYGENLAFFACSHAGLKVCRIHDKGIEVLQTLPMECSYDVTIFGSRLYSAEGKDGICIYDIGANGKLTKVKRYRPSNLSEYVELLHVYGGGKFIAWHGRGGRLTILDIRDLDHIHTALHHNQVGILYNDNLTDCDLNGIGLCNFSRGLACFDFSGDAPKLLKSYLNDLRFDHNNNAAVACKGKFIIPYNGKLAIIDPATITTAKEFVLAQADGGEICGTPSVDGNMMVIVRRSKGNIQTYDMTDLLHPKFVPARSWTDVPFIPDRIAFWKGRMVIAGGPEGVFMETADNARRR